MFRRSPRLNVLILGIDGYIGWSLALHLLSRGHTVAGIDNFSRRTNVGSVSSDSAIPIPEIGKRIEACERILGKKIRFYEGDILNYDLLRKVFSEFRPESIVHLAEQPSAPFSMISREHAVYTQHNNVEGSLNILYAMKEFSENCHLVKLGTMGEYGTPNVPIPEGFFEVEYRGRKDLMPFPRQPNSMYHLSKVHDSANLHFACRVWNFRATDVMQGVVYGTRVTEMTDDTLLTRFDFDESFGTVINRYCAQAVIGFPLTPYGAGHQKRGFIDLVDSIQCLTIAIEKPADRAQYRVFNQLDEVYDITGLAEKVVEASSKFGLKVEVNHVPNPRLEKEDHYYEVEHNHLRELGFRPTRKIEQTLDIILEDLLRYRERILQHKDAIMPRTKWVEAKSPKPVGELLHERLVAYDGDISKISQKDGLASTHRLSMDGSGTKA